MQEISISKEQIDSVVLFQESNPSSILGPHVVSTPDGEITLVRAFLPRATSSQLRLESGKTLEMEQVDDRGLWEVRVSGHSHDSKYQIAWKDASGYTNVTHDPYAFTPFLTDYDLHLFSEGTHRNIYEKMGAHPRQTENAGGVNFAVWAPNARAVSVVGNFNHWNVGESPMNSRGTSGVWEIFIPGLDTTEVYKYAIKSNVDGVVRLKTDPYAFAAEVRPRTAALVSDPSEYDWHDGDWIHLRKSKSPQESPMAIYELHLGSWKRKPDGSYYTYRELADELVPYVKGLGFTHVELMPLMEHPLDDSWGYQVVNYFAPTSRYGKPTDFMYFVDKCHQENIGVILDWVPAHFPKDDYGLALFDGTYLYEHSDPRIGEHPDWGTLIFNYSRNEVKEFLISNALFWLDKYHVDGLRLDAVASMLYLDYSRKPGEWVPNKYGGRENLDALEFLRNLTQTVHSLFPNTLLIAEESTAWPGVTHSVKKGGLGFDLKWNMGWMHDTLQYFTTDAIFRKHHQRDLTFGLLYAFSEQFILVFSHDEVVYGKRSLFNKMPGDDWQRYANLRLLLGYMYGSPGKKLLFMGSEFAQFNEWNFRTSLDWANSRGERNQKTAVFLRDLNALYSSRKSLHELDFSYDGFEWIDFKDTEQSVLSFIRKPRVGDSFLVFVFNMTPVPRYEYRIGVPEEGYYKEILNSDAQEYGGGGIGNYGGVASDDVQWHQRPFSIKLTLPPLAVEVFEFTKRA